MIKDSRTRTVVGALGALLGVTASMWACGDSPTAPSSALPTATSTLSGQVAEMTEAGPVPVAGALVRVGSELPLPRDATTDDDGRYVLAGLPDGSVSVTTSKDGYVTDVQTVPLSGDTKLDIRVVRRVSHTLSGLVFETTSAGPSPVEGVEVYCEACGHLFAYTDQSGFYRFSSVLNGVVPLLVAKPGFELRNPTTMQLAGAYGMIDATVDGDTRFDIELIRR
jgi:hypothetical protein